MKISKAVLDTLHVWHRQQAGELLTRLDISRPSLMRAMIALDGQVVTRGRARRTAYAARRSIRGRLDPLPLYAVDEAGRVHDTGLLEPIYPTGCAMQYANPLPWPLDDEMRDGWFRGLPYPLADMRPQGFLGRNFAHQFAAILQVDEDVKRWNEDDILHVLSVLGADQAGNYILGEQALRNFLEEQQRGTHFLSDTEIETAYPLHAVQALNFGVVGSSAAGEFPKFTQRRLMRDSHNSIGDLRGRPQHVIVKFSGIDGSPQEQRWSDLLVCEHLALCTIADTLGLSAAQSRIYQFGGRSFYEVERFDRHGEFGRSGVCSWHEINFALYGGTGTWSEAANVMLNDNTISADTARQIILLEQFGRLIANSDMHDGNLAFQPGMKLAPAYDMLPMLYAPQRGVELIERKFAPPLPIPSERRAWVQAADAAVVFWHRVASDQRVSGEFRATADSNAVQLERLLVMQRD